MLGYAKKDTALPGKFWHGMPRIGKSRIQDNAFRFLFWNMAQLIKKSNWHFNSSKLIHPTLQGCTKNRQYLYN